MIALNALIAICLAYVAFLFGVAFLAERAARAGRVGWLRAPLVYTLSLSIYCTAWTFYGAVGTAARTGFEFIAIYLGPSLVMAGFFWVVRKLVRIGRAQRITSIADLISSRYGKSNLLAICVTLLAVLGTTPYIALQLQSVTLSFEVFGLGGSAVPERSTTGTAFWVAMGLAIFTVIFGTRNLDANERHNGVVMAIAVEAVVKLAALLAVGAFVVWGLAGGIGETLARIETSPAIAAEIAPGRWAGIIFLSAAAFLCLPRIFQVLVVEAVSEDHLRTASWAFPLYLFLMSLFVVPIAVTGLDLLPQGSNPDLFVLTVPLSQGQDGLAVFAFLGGFSSATSMVIVAAIALSTMLSNHIVMPVWLRLTGGGASISGDVRHVVLTARRISIALVVFLGYAYYALSGGGTALSSIGLVSFTGVTQVLPALLGGLFWRGATRAGAAAGLFTGFAVWAYTLFLPSLGAGAVMPAEWFAAGPGGIGWLRPQALFGLGGIDPLLHAILWSMALNTLAFVLGSLASFPGPVERLQGAQFVNVFQHAPGPRSWSAGLAQSEDLLIMAQRILGAREALTLFHREAARQGRGETLPEPTPGFLEALERELAGSVGAATAHAMVGQIVGGMSVSVEDLMAVADESAQLMEYSARLEAKSSEQARTARQLREANAKLTRLSVQKDGFLSQISHELRTPMSSIRAFSEILRDGAAEEGERAKFASIIHDETLRLTRLLDDLLDLSVLEHGHVTLNPGTGPLSAVIDRAIAAALADGGAAPLEIVRDPSSEAAIVTTDQDRLAQVFINLVSNARKYCDAARPVLEIRVRAAGEGMAVDFIDNGSGVPVEARDEIFEKFARTGETRAGGAGLGLAICREIMTRLGGSVRLLDGAGGAAFRVIVPNALARAAE